jgi:hypothetical protein
MLPYFFYIRRIVHYEFVPTRKTVNQIYYGEVLKRLCEKSWMETTQTFCQQLVDLAS